MVSTLSHSPPFPKDADEAAAVPYALDAQKVAIARRPARAFHLEACREQAHGLHERRDRAPLAVAVV